jgi:hypothetical protein
MADIFISYAREDREWVEKLAKALTGEGFTVWWDWDLLVGKRYRETIETELQTCKATVVVWSQHSIRSDFVRDEAEEGQQRNILVPLLKENVRPPAGFRQLQSADLTQWTGAVDHVEFRRMLRGLTHVIGGDPPAEKDHAEAAPPVTPEPVPAPVVEAVVPAATPVAAPPRAPAAPEPVVPKQPAPIAQPVPAPKPPAGAASGTHAAATTAAGAIPATLSSPFAAMKMPPSSHPVWRYVAIGAVVFVALIYGAMQLWPSSKPLPPKAVAASGGGVASPAPATPAPPAPSGGDTRNEGRNGGGSATPATPAPATPAPATTDTSAGAATDTSGLSSDIADVVTKAEAADRQARTQAGLAASWQKTAQSGTGGAAGADGMTAGTLTMTQGAYAGQIYSGVAQGLGVVTYGNGDVYSGQFDEGTISGAGVVTFANTTNAFGYSGQWGANIYNGYGVFYLSNGSRFEGTFRAGHMTGPGALVGHDGKVIQQGQYQDGVLKP